MKKQAVRIISGLYKRRLVHFGENIEGLRPTPDRVKQVLFNWLQNYVCGAKCIDCYSGSGSLGFESLSNGADFCLFIDTNSNARAQINKNAESLKISNANYKIIGTSALTILESLKDNINIIFLDPPFNKGLAENSLNVIESNTNINHEVYIYVETEKEALLPSIIFFDIIKQKSCGNVKIMLLKKKIK